MDTSTVALWCLITISWCWYHMQGQASLARYCHLPIGNMTGDWILSTADAIYARCLRDAGHLLWMSDSSLPDIAAQDVISNSADELIENSQLTMEVNSLAHNFHVRVPPIKFCQDLYDRRSSFLSLRRQKITWSQLDLVDSAFPFLNEWFYYYGWKATCLWQGSLFWQITLKVSNHYDATAWCGLGINIMRSTNIL